MSGNIYFHYLWPWIPCGMFLWYTKPLLIDWAIAFEILIDWHFGSLFYFHWQWIDIDWTLWLNPGLIESMKYCIILVNHGITYLKSYLRRGKASGVITTNDTGIYEYKMGLCLLYAYVPECHCQRYKWLWNDECHC